MLLAGCLLAFGAGFANAAVVFQTGTSVSHLTGDVARLSFDIVLESPGLAAGLLSVIAATGGFFGGAFLAGLLIHHPQLDTARPYGRAIFSIGILFIVSHYLLISHPVIAITISAFACGFQNSLVSRYRGLVLRTTHLTGLITDFGITLGMSARGFEIPRWKILVPAAIALSFFSGGTASFVMSLRFHFPALLILGVGYVSAGLLWTIYKHVYLGRPWSER